MQKPHIRRWRHGWLLQLWLDDREGGQRLMTVFSARSVPDIARAWPIVMKYVAPAAIRTEAKYHVIDAAKQDDAPPGRKVWLIH